MQRQILHLLRCRVVGQIGRAGADHRMAGAKSASHQIGVEIVGDAHGQIDPFLHQIDGSVQQQDIDGGARVLRQIVVGGANQQGFREGVTAGDPQLSFGGIIPLHCDLLHLLS